MWKAADQQLLCLLLSSLTKEAIIVIFGFSTTRKARLGLENTFNHHSEVRELRLKDDLQLMKRDTKPVAVYARTFKIICDQLHAIDRPVKDIDKVHLFLRGFDTNFLIFSTSHMALTPLPYFADLVSKAESFELYQRSLVSSNSAPTTFTTTNRGRTHGSHFSSCRNKQDRSYSYNKKSSN